jgi:hypothetical protein
MARRPLNGNKAEKTNIVLPLIFETNTAVTNQPQKKHYQQHSLLIRGGYEPEPAYHPNPAVARMWSSQ